ncbi:hypothetical protein CrRp3_cds44 [Citrobacter phage vB_CroP_CrRp3]|uniref:Polysaccharide chain length determinant protein n=1 Tax=Citrobacter phage vB_CroP_CrRp3 TaxID=2079275 RepID=A0A2K9VAX0_9CAUD|nr:polysaccharide chain length determinant protein [Citrobacter phage vB_CroP_CrRp3]AUV59334.1 hypothetical protein CrRp3_cds44 [Citrobacter phage vB_CroP_CrRp3]
MSMVTTLVFVAQYFRGLANKFKAKAIKAIESRIEAVQAEQVEVEEHRSSQMIDCHNRYYASRDDLNARQVKEVEEMLARHQQERDNLKADFEENKASIALVHQSASDSLKKEIVMLEMELDSLTK